MVVGEYRPYANPTLQLRFASPPDRSGHTISSRRGFQRNGNSKVKIPAVLPCGPAHLKLRLPVDVEPETVTIVGAQDGLTREWVEGKIRDGNLAAKSPFLEAARGWSSRAVAQNSASTAL